MVSAVCVKWLSLTVRIDLVASSIISFARQYGEKTDGGLVTIAQLGRINKG